MINYEIMWNQLEQKLNKIHKEHLDKSKTNDVFNIDLIVANDMELCTDLMKSLKVDYVKIFESNPNIDMKKAIIKEGFITGWKE